MNQPSILSSKSTLPKTSDNKNAKPKSPKPKSPSHTDIVLTTVFDRLLSLKRKGDETDPFVHPSKRANPLSLQNESPMPSHQLQGNQATRRVCKRGRPTKALKNLSLLGEIVEFSLVEVSISQSPVESGDASMAEVKDKDWVLVVVPKQPQFQWETLESFRRRLHFAGFYYVDPVGLSGDLALWWKDNVDIDVHFKSKNLLRCNVSWPSNASRWLATFIYAPPSWNQRAIFWDTMRKIHEENKYPWICVEDFNEVGFIWEKQGGNECNRARIEQFQQMLSDCDFMDLEFKGQAYTWSNNQGGANNIRDALIGQ
ncbi:hypothetical protein Vadar_014063 [Vaccinium darrowii]|uniref:Uncharacterized protein n=1 Tax=Vaccinium darrowii TaxID=229202 RepID=A0ACB7YVF9_9ERIC|nr:hypothetical protein Vadar_014063 [Vaccinium darrowii]